MSEAQKGKKHSDDTKKKIGVANKGKKRSVAQNIKNSERQKGKCHRPMSDETKRKISEAKKGKKRGPMSEEQKQKISEAQKGKKRHPRSEETKRKISETKKGCTAWNKGLTKETDERVKRNYTKNYNIQ